MYVFLQGYRDNPKVNAIYVIRGALSGKYCTVTNICTFPIPLKILHAIFMEMFLWENNFLSFFLKINVLINMRKVIEL